MYTKCIVTVFFCAILIAGCGSDDTQSSSSGSSSSSSSSTSSSSGSDLPLSSEPTFFSNPLFNNGADPWMRWFEGNYYLLTTTWTSQIVMRKSPTIEGLKTAAPVYVWSDTTLDRCCNFWAFEMHRLNGPSGYRWYLMFTAGHEANLDRQHLVVLESEADDPMGPYRLAGEPMVNRWNIDGTYLEVNGNLYVLWSEWDGDLQKNWIQQMSNPWTVTGVRAELSAPEYDWERQPGIDNPGLVTEAPEVLQHNGRTFVTYSASSCNGPEYKLGLLELSGNNPLSPSSWYKFPNPVFQRGNGAFGTGHNGFFKSPDGTQDWLVYHANANANEGCGDSRSVRAQVIQWNSDGTPNFGSPAVTGNVLAAPSGESGPLSAKVQGAAMHLMNENSEYCLSGSGSSDNLHQATCSGDQAQWVLDSTNDGRYRLGNRATGLFLQVSGCGLTDGANISQGEWSNRECQKWVIEESGSGWVSLQNAESGKYLDVANCGTGDGDNVAQWAGNNSACQHWSIQPAQQVAIVNAESGKALDIPDCNAALGSNIQQYEWVGSSCQKWLFEKSSAGYLKVKPAFNVNACMGFEAGNNLTQNSCSTTASDFYIVPLSDGAMSIRSRDSGQALDIDSCSISNSANAQLYDWLDNNCQRFYFRDVTQVEIDQSSNVPLDTVQPSTWALSGNLGSHDPTIIEENGVWWQFQTGVGIYGKTSNDGLNWQPLPSVLPQPLSWWNNYVPDHVNNDVWAPDIHVFNGRTWMYYSISTFGSKVSAIGLISSPSVAEGNWRDDGLVIATDNSNNYNAIDPNLIITPEGEPWMVFGSWNTGIMLSEINPSTMKPVGQLYNLATRDGGIEGPTLIHRNGYYYLFVSVGRCCAGVDSTYQILVGRSAAITGPYLDKNGNNMRDGAGFTLKQTSGNWVGPGGQDIHEGIISYHSYDANQNGSAFLRIETLGWDSNGWPYLN